MISGWFKGKRLLKWTAFLTVFIFAFTSVSQASPYSFAGSPGQGFPTPPYLEFPPLTLSQELGKVEEVFRPPSRTETPFVYLIQDAHDSLDAQENIRRILQELVEKEKVSHVFFEGGSVELERSFYRVADDKTNERIWNELFSEGGISGLERYALESPKRIRFFGLEDEKLYFDNIRSVQKIYASGENAGEVIRKIDSQFEKARTRFLTGDLKKILDTRRAFDEKRISLERYAQELSRWAEKICSLNLKDSRSQDEWPQLVRLTKLSEFEKRLKKNEAEIKKELNVIARSSEGATWRSRSNGIATSAFRRTRNDEQLNFIWDPS